jgi:hypothetical protein
MYVNEHSLYTPEQILLLPLLRPQGKQHKSEIFTSPANIHQSY